MTTSWSLRGTVLVACNCAYGCPCNFNALPTYGKCEGGWTWHVEDGRYDGTDLSGLTFTLMVNWPGAIHEGNGEGVLLVDERADDVQRERIHTLVKGGAGGPWGILGWTWPTLHGPEPVRYALDLNGIHSRVRGGDAFELEVEPIRNPVTGAEVTPGAVLPEGIVFKRADFASAPTFRFAPLGFDFSGRNASVAAFEYVGP